LGDLHVGITGSRTLDSGREENGMTDQDRHKGSGGMKDNVGDELDDAAKRKKDASKEAVEEEESTGSHPGGSGTKDNVEDELDESQRRE
jgi:hypothetical protein